MARVINIDDKQEKIVTHKECGAVVGYFLVELKSFSKTHYDGSSTTYYYLTCPQCGEQIIVRTE